MRFMPNHEYELAAILMEGDLATCHRSEPRWRVFRYAHQFTGWKYMKRDKAIIGARLREAREMAKVTKEDAAEAAGVQTAAITAWERGTALPNLVQVRGLLTSYGMSGFKLLFGSCPIELTQDEARELANVALSPRLRVKMDVVLALTRRVGRSEATAQQ